MRKFHLGEYTRMSMLLAAILAVCFYDVVFLGKTFKVSTVVASTLPTGVYGQENNQSPHMLTFGVDTAVLEEPVYEFVKQSLRQGRFPFWNPYQACGYPLIAMADFGLFFPLHFILYLLPNPISWDVLILARFFLAALFMYLFMRYIRFRPLPSLTAGIAFMLSGPLLLIQNQTASVDILLPLYLLAVEALIRNPTRKRLAGHAAAFALVVYAGHPEHVFFVVLIGFLYLAHRMIVNRRALNLSQVLSGYFLSCILGAGLAAATLFPFIYNYKTLFWHGHPEGMGLLTEEIRARMVSILAPHFFQKEAMSNDWVPLGWLGGYLGMIPLSLAALSLSQKQKRGLNFFFAGLAFLLWAKGYGFGFINWIGYLPIFKTCRFSYHVPAFVAFCVAVLSGMGMRVFLLRREVIGKGLIIAGAIAGIVAVFWFKSQGQPYAEFASRATGYAFFLLVCWIALFFLRHDRVNKKILGLALVGLMMLELFSYIDRNHPDRYHTFPKTPYIEFIRQQSEGDRSYGMFWHFFPNVASAYGVHDLGIFDGLIMDNYVQFINNFVLLNNFVQDLRPTTLRSNPLLNVTEFLNLLNLRFLITTRDVPLPKEFVESDRLRLVYDKEAQIYERQGFMPRSFVVHRAIFDPQGYPKYSTLRYYRNALDRLVIISGRPEPDILFALQNAPEKDESTAKIVKNSPNEIVVQSDIKNPGFLVLSDTYHPDWVVFVDGNPTKLYQADYLLRAVFLPAGIHDVRFVFRPKSFYLGLAVSLLSLFLTLCVCNSRRFR